MAKLSKDELVRRVVEGLSQEPAPLPKTTEVRGCPERPDTLLALACTGCQQASPILYRLGRVYRCPQCLKPGAQIWWEAGGEVRGPAVVQDLTFNSGGLWCWVKSPDREAWVLASHITKLEST